MTVSAAGPCSWLPEDVPSRQATYYHVMSCVCLVCLFSCIFLAAYLSWVVAAFLHCFQSAVACEQEWEAESRSHGWPSFRDSEVIWDDVRCLPDGVFSSISQDRFIVALLFFNIIDNVVITSSAFVEVGAYG